MKSPIYVATKVVTTTLEFFPIPAHPKALLVKMSSSDGKTVTTFVTPKMRLDDLTSRGADVFEAYSVQDFKSLPTGARYWFVPPEALGDKERELWAFAEDSMSGIDNPSWIPLYMSGWDHQVWDIDGKPLIRPVELELWMTHFDLNKVEAHLKGHPAVINFEIEPNDCYSNWEISGQDLGWLTIDPSKLGIDFSVVDREGNGHDPKPTKSWLLDNVVHDFYGKYDVLELKQFHKKA